VQESSPPTIGLLKEREKLLYGLFVRPTASVTPHSVLLTVGPLHQVLLVLLTARVQAEFKRERARAERIGTSRIHEERKHTYTYTKLTCSRVHALAHSLIQRERESARAREREREKRERATEDIETEIERVCVGVCVGKDTTHGEAPTKSH
jgi:hypothetical protein